MFHDAGHFSGVDAVTFFQEAMVKRYGSQIVYLSPMIHGPFSSWPHQAVPFALAHEEDMQ